MPTDTLSELPYDVSRCVPAGLCLKRMRCARFTSRGGDHSPRTAFDPIGCEAFVPLPADDASSGGGA